MNESTQRFNHVAMSVPAAALSAESREALLEFYGQVFGWTEMPTMTLDNERLVLRAHSNEQFVFLHASEDPMRCKAMEHFGLSVATLQELDGILERATAYKTRDPRVELSEGEHRDYKAVVLHSFYVRYLLPLTVEVQCYEWAPGFDAQRVG